MEIGRKGINADEIVLELNAPRVVLMVLSLPMECIGLVSPTGHPVHESGLRCSKEAQAPNRVRTHEIHV